MMKLFALALAVAGCTKAQPEPSAAPAPKSTPAPAVAFAQPPPTTTPPPQAQLDVKVELTAVTLADDCDAIAPLASPPAGGVRGNSAVRTRADRGAMAREYRQCEQTSMQLALSASTVSQIQIKSVELLDEHGTSLGLLTATKPTRWSDATSRYDVWDEALAADTPAKVSYRLSQPNWSKIGNRWNRTYTLKTVVSIGGVDRSVKRDVMRTAPTALPANVRT